MFFASNILQKLCCDFGNGNSSLYTLLKYMDMDMHLIWICMDMDGLTSTLMHLTLNFYIASAVPVTVESTLAP